MSAALRTTSIACLLLVGCSGPDPAQQGMVSAQGKVVRKGGQPFPGGAIEFRPADGSEGVSSGEIQPDGSFTLATLVGDDVVPGIKPGQYQVTVVPRMGEDQSATPPIQLKNPYAIEPDGGPLTIQVD
jgi:hypothetical protein